ncbi:lasso peptide biosynthesis B2 protein [Aurantiacibacter hainanensis]|uniref:lasso peptide biosynthesis B2 protein n=1 Tax=Aurantiacibacter hainanensis TaxID=3076114 RepID=UPI003365495E
MPRTVIDLAQVSRRIGSIRRGEARAIVRGIWELAKARLRHLRLTPTAISNLNDPFRGASGQAVENAAALEYLRGQALAIRRASLLVPWRSDCLVQAIALQRWSARAGIKTAITLQVGRDQEGEFVAHAILRYGHTVVLGAGELPLRDLYTPEPE